MKLANMVAALRAAGVLPDMPELLDATWLASYLPPEGSPSRDPDPGDVSAADGVRPAMVTARMSARSSRARRPAPAEPESAAAGSPPAVGGSSRTGRPGSSDRGGVLHGFPPGGSDSILEVGIPAVRALADPLALAASFRPVKSHTAAGREYEVDEVATADFIAETRIWLPVLRPTAERWLRLTIVEDVGRSMPIWQPTIDEFVTLAERTGVFRDVRRYHLDPDSRGEAVIARGTGPPGREDEMQPAATQLVVVLTDGVGDAWRDGRVHTLLQRLAVSSAVVVVSLLPSRMWPGTGLRTSRARLRAPLPGAPNEEWLGAPEPSPIPLMELSPSQLGGFFTMISGTSAWWECRTLSPPRPPDSVVTPPVDGREAVRRFFAAATPAGQRLARCLAAAAPLTPDVMRLVRTIMLPDAGTAHLAEVVLGGLLEQDPALSPTPGSVAYDFVPGARDALLEKLPRAEAIEVADRVSTYVGGRAGRPARFSLLLADPREASVDAYREVPHLARVNATILNLLGPQYRQLATRLDPPLAGSASKTRKPALPPPPPFAPATFDVGGVSGPPLPGWGALTALAVDAEPSAVLDAAARDLAGLRDKSAETIDPALSFRVVGSRFPAGEAARLLVAVGDDPDRTFPITYSALLRGRHLHPLDVLASAVASPSEQLDRSWRPRRVGEAVEPGERAYAYARRVFRQPGVIEDVNGALDLDGVLEPDKRRDVLLVGLPGSGRSALATIVAHDFRQSGHGVIWLDLTDPADGAETVVSTLLRMARHDRYLLVVDGLQANLPIMDGLFTVVTRLRHLGIRLQLLATSWPAIVEVLGRRESSNQLSLQRVPVRAERSIASMLDEYGVRGDDRRRIVELADDDVHLALKVIDLYRDRGVVPTVAEMQAFFTEGADTAQMRFALYYLACLGLFGLTLGEMEADAKFNPGVVAALRAGDLVQSTDGAVTIAPRSRARLVMRYAREHWEHVREQPPEVLVGEYVMAGGDRLIRATLSRIDKFFSPERLRTEDLSLLSTWDMSERVGLWLARRTEEDPGWGDNLGAAVFAGVALARLHRDDLWLSIAARIRERWRYGDDLIRPEPVDGVTSDFEDFAEIAARMKEADARNAYGRNGHPSKITGAMFEAEKEKAYRNWCLGLLLCFEGTAPPRYFDAARVGRLLEIANRAAEIDGGFYPARMPWITARIVIGLCVADLEPQANPVISHACSWLLSLLKGRRGGQTSYWGSGTGSWNSDEQTTAICVLALSAAGRDDRNEVRAAVTWLIGRQRQWSAPGREIDLAQVVEALAVCTEEPFHDHVKLLLTRTINELETAPDVARPEENLRMPFLAAQLTEIVWATLQREFVWTLRSVMSAEGDETAVTNRSPIEEAPVGAVEVRSEQREAGPGRSLTENELGRWQAASRLLENELNLIIQQRSAADYEDVPEVRRMLDLYLRQRDEYYELLDKLDPYSTAETLRNLDRLGRQVCKNAWPPNLRVPGRDQPPAGAE